MHINVAYVALWFGCLTVYYCLARGTVRLTLVSKVYKKQHQAVSMVRFHPKVRQITP